MCKLKKYKTSNTRIDECMRIFIQNLNMFRDSQIRILACCCGHGKYPMTVIIDAKHGIYDLISGKTIPRKRRFYKKDKQGYYYIPEVIKFYKELGTK